MKDSYLELDFFITHRAGARGWYADGDLLSLVNLGLIVFFNKYRLTSSSRKERQKIDNAHVIRSLHILISSSRGNDDLLIGFHRSIEAGEK